MHLWEEACNTTIYLQNHSPHEVIGMITLEEDFSGRKSDASYFRIFGVPEVCVSYRLLQTVLFLTDSVFIVLFAYFDDSMASKIAYKP